MKTLIAGALVASVVFGQQIATLGSARDVPAARQTSAAPAAGPGGATTIAYVKGNSQTGDEIWLGQPDGSDKHKIYSTNTTEADGILSLAWRPDSAELAFSSGHEMWMSYYTSDIYAVSPDGSGARRVTNAPDPAEYPKYPTGTVVINLTNVSGTAIWLYVEGAPEVIYAGYASKTLTISGVADLGDVPQPIVTIYGIQGKRSPVARWVDVVAGQTVETNVAADGVGLVSVGATAPHWRSDGSKIGYAFAGRDVYGISDRPPLASQGEALFNPNGAMPTIMSYRPTPGRANEVVYWNMPIDGNPTLYLTTEGSVGPGTPLFSTGGYWVYQMQWLPDASGILLAMDDPGFMSANIYRYDFRSGQLAQITNYPDKNILDFTISPTGQQIVYQLCPWFYYGATCDLWMSNIDGNNPQLFELDAYHPAWSAGVVPPVTPN